MITQRNYAELAARIGVIEQHIKRINQAIEVLGGKNGAHQVAVMYLESKRWSLCSETNAIMSEMGGDRQSTQIRMTMEEVDNAVTCGECGVNLTIEDHRKGC